MKCFVCGKDHDRGVCPVCGFPRIEVPGDASIEDAIRANKQTIDAYRSEFLENVSIGIEAFYWKDSDGSIVPDGQKTLVVGSGAGMLNNVVWLNQPFARLKDRDTLDLTVSVSRGDEKREFSVSMPNLPESELQQFGAVLDDSLRLTVALRNSAGYVKSDPIAVFE